MADENENTQSDDGDQGPPVTIHLGDQSAEGAVGGDGIDIIDAGGGSDAATGGRNYNIILGGSDSDYLRSDGIWDDVFGGSGDDIIVATGHGAWLFGGSGNDIILGSDNVFLPELLHGGTGDDTIGGGGGRDVIIGGAGDDSLTGGTGADAFVFWEGHGADTIHDFDFAEGDTIHLTNFDETIAWEELSTKLSTVTDENGVVTGVQIDLSDWGGGTIVLNGITSISDVTADMFVLDRIVGSDGVDDTLQGGASDDTMSGGTGADTFAFDEESGNDTIADFNAAEGDRIDLTGFDMAIAWEQLISRVTTVTDENGDAIGLQIDLGDFGGGTITLNGISSVSELSADMFVLHPLAGSDGVDDTISSASGDDTMSGGTGADTFVFGEGHGDDTVTDFDTANDRIDLSNFSQAITWEELSAKITQIEDDASTTDVDETATVIDLSDWGGGTIVLQGVTASDLSAGMFDLPDGSAGSYYYGNSGDNTIEAGRGHDVVFGMEGDDTLSGGVGHDVVFGGEGDDTLDGGEGSDLLMGGEGDDVIDGGSGDDLLIGGAGDDTMTGGAGADTFVFVDDHGNDTITDFDPAQDKIDLTTLHHALTWDELSATFSTVTDGDNVATGVMIDLTEYGGGTIVLEGITDPGALTEDMFNLYTLTGGEGDDTIEGGTSDDTMTGGGGGDTFVFSRLSSGDDTITDFTDGEDTIDLSSFTDISGFGDLSDNATQNGSDVVIDLSAYGGGTITLQGFALDDLDETDFVFHDSSPADGQHDGM